MSKLYRKLQEEIFYYSTDFKAQIVSNKIVLKRFHAVTNYFFIDAPLDFSSKWVGNKNFGPGKKYFLN